MNPIHGRDRANFWEGGIVIGLTFLSALSWTLYAWYYDNSQLFPQLELDIRSLAVGRMGLGVIILWDVLERYRDVPFFYDDNSCCPRHLLLSGGDPRLKPSDFSIYFSVGSTTSVRILLLLFGGLSSIALMLGYYTQTAAFLCWIHWRSIESRNGVIHQAGDLLLRLILWWAIFLPIGSCWSLDSFLGYKPFLPLSPIASFGLIHQISCVYFFTAMFKTDKSWKISWLGNRTKETEPSAIHLVLSNYNFSRDPFASYLLRLSSQMRHKWDLTRILTRISFWIEFAVLPLLLGVFPGFPTRLMAVTTLIGFHSGIALTMRIGAFPAACITSWIFLTPSCFWDSLSIPIPPFAVGNEELGSVLRTSDVMNYIANYCLITPIMLISILFALRSNLSRLPIKTPDGSNTNTSSKGRYNFKYFLNFFLEEGLWCKLTVIQQSTELELCRVMGQQQQWFMFDKPARKDRWFISIGHCDDGTLVDLFASVYGRKIFHPITTSPPPPWTMTYRSHRWRKFFSRLLESRHHQLRKQYAEFICNQWNKTFSKSTNKTVIKFEMCCIRRSLLLEAAPHEETSLLWKFNL
jgi:Vitamin K-dependent gamma-carboxylase